MAKVANCIDNTNFDYTNFDHHLALSVATYPCKEDRSKHCAPSRSSWEGLSASCSAACSSFGAGHGSLSDKLRCDGDWEDDRSTVCDWEDDNLSLCDDELADADLADVEATNQELTAVQTSVENDPSQVQPTSQAFIADPSILQNDPSGGEPNNSSWTDLVDDEDADFGFTIRKRQLEVAFAVPAGSSTRWADISDSDEECALGHSSNSASTSSNELVKVPEPQAVQLSRGSRRARAASKSVAADDRCIETATEKAAGKVSTTTGKWSSAVKTAPSSHAVGKDEGKPSHAKGAHKGAGKGSNKGAERQANKDIEKGASKGVGKGGGKRAGKGVDQNAGKSKGASKGASKFANKGASKGSGKGHEKFQCQIIVGIEEDSKFRVVRRLIGSGGANMKSINEQSGAKLRLRGRGSKFLEGDEQKESTDDLMLCLSTQDKEGFEAAKRMASELLEGIHHSYRAFCAKAGKECPDLTLQLHEGYRYGSR